MKNYVLKDYPVTEWEVIRRFFENNQESSYTRDFILLQLKNSQSEAFWFLKQHPLQHQVQPTQSPTHSMLGDLLHHRL